MSSLNVCRLSLCMLLLSVLAPAMTAHGQSSDALTMVPADAPLAVMTPKLSQLRENLSSFIQAMEMPMLPADPVGLVMAQMGLFQGVDESKGAGYYLFSEEALGVPVSRIFGLDDSAEPMMPDQMPMAIFFGGSSVEEVFSMFSPTPEGDNVAFMMQGAKVYGRAVNGYIIVSPNPRAVDAAATLTRTMAQSVDERRRSHFEAADIMTFVDAGKMRPVIDKAVNAFNAQMDATAGYMPPEQAQGIKTAESVFKSFAALVSQVAGVDFGASFSAQRLQFDKFVRPREDTELAAMLGAIKPTGRDLLAGLPAQNYFAAFGINLGDAMESQAGQKVMRELTRWSMNMSGAKVDQARMDAYLDKLMGFYGDDYYSSAVFMGGDEAQPMYMLGMNKLKNSKGYLEFMAENIDFQRELMAGQLAAMGGETTIDYEQGVATVAGMKVDRFSITPPANYPGPDMGFFTMYMAAMDDAVAVATGSADKLEMLKNPGQTLDSLPAVQAATKALPAKSFLACVVNIPATYNFVVDMVKKNTADMSPQASEMLKQAAPTTQDLVVFGGGYDQGLMHGRMILPSGLFKDAMKVVMMLQQQSMQGDGPSGPPASDF